MSHTPGPWSTEPFGSSVVGLGVWASGGRHVAGLALPCQGEPEAIRQFREEQFANARLIAAAPVMLHALQCAPCVCFYDGDEKHVCLRCAAIAKATQP